MSVNRLMCSIHQTLYTSSTKREPALYAGAIVPLRGAEKASYKLLQKKNRPQRHSSGEQRGIEQDNSHVQRGRGGNSSTYVELQRGLIFFFHLPE